MRESGAGVLARAWFSTSLPGFPAALNRRPAGRTSVSREASVTHWVRAAGPVGYRHDRVPVKARDTHSGDVSRVYEFK